MSRAAASSEGPSATLTPPAVGTRRRNPGPPVIKARQPAAKKQKTAAGIAGNDSATHPRCTRPPRASALDDDLQVFAQDHERVAAVVEPGGERRDVRGQPRLPGGVQRAERLVGGAVKPAEHVDEVLGRLVAEHELLPFGVD